MRTLLTAVIAALTLATVPVVGMAAAAADTDGECPVNGITPATVVLGNTPVSRRLEVLTRSTCQFDSYAITISSLGLAVHGPATGRSECFTFFGDDVMHGQPVVAGKYRALVQFTDDEGYPHSGGADFYLKKNTSWSGSFEAGPEPVRGNAGLTVTATLKRADWIDPYYSVYGGRHVEIQFAPAGSSDYTTVKKVQLSTAGRLSTTVPATRSGKWRVLYRGNSGAGPATSNVDSVVVSP